MENWSRTITDNANNIYTILVSTPPLNSDYDEKNQDRMNQMTFYNPLLVTEEIYNEDDYMFINVEDINDSESNSDNRGERNDSNNR